MTATVPDLPPDVEGPPAVGPGDRLREARHAAKLSIGDIAARLHLDPKIIRALEADDYDHLPAPTFTRGYLRGYARTIGLPARPVLDAFDGLGLAPPTLVADIADRPQARSTDIPVRLVSYGVVAGLVALVVLWYHSQNEARTPPIETALVSPAPEIAEANTREGAAGDLGTTLYVPPTESGGLDEPVEPTLPEESIASAPPATPEPAPEPAAEDPAVEATPAPTAVAPAADTSDGPAGATLASTAAGDVADTDAAPAVEAPASADAGAEAGADAPAAAAASSPVDTAPPGSGPDLDRLTIRFSEESWVEVYDRDGERLFYNLAKPGRTVELTGAGPMRVLLGNAGDAKVSYNGTPFDYGGFTSRGIARFTLGNPIANAESPEGSRVLGVTEGTQIE